MRATLTTCMALLSVILMCHGKAYTSNALSNFLWYILLFGLLDHNRTPLVSDYDCV